MSKLWLQFQVASAENALPAVVFLFKDWLVQLRYFIEENPEKPGWVVSPSLRVFLIQSIFNILSAAVIRQCSLLLCFVLSHDFCSGVLFLLGTDLGFRRFYPCFSHGPAWMVNQWDWNRICFMRTWRLICCFAPQMTLVFDHGDIFSMMKDGWMDSNCCLKFKHP